MALILAATTYIVCIFLGKFNAQNPTGSVYLFIDVIEVSYALFALSRLTDR